MTRKAKVLMVCTGNICRSPAMHYQAYREWGEAAEVTSAGTHAETRMDSTPQMRAAAAGFGLTYPRHRPTQLDPALIARSDLVLVATEHHATWIAKQAGALPDHVFVFKEAIELAGRAPAPSGDAPAERLMSAAAVLHSERLRDPAPLRSLDDPWGQGQATHDRVMGEIVEGIEALTQWALGH